jgi:hypothetical protein
MGIRARASKQDLCHHENKPLTTEAHRARVVLPPSNLGVFRLDDRGEAGSGEPIKPVSVRGSRAIGLPRLFPIESIRGCQIRDINGGDAKVRPGIEVRVIGGATSSRFSLDDLV